MIESPIFLIFFNRPDTFYHVFEAVRKQKPKKLFLVCDGPRENYPNDLLKVNECKKIAENIDWECEVYKDYSEENLGCGMRMYSGLNWAFKYTDRIIILEDDCVPGESFFPFCNYLLEKYKDDNRVYMINGMNHLKIYDACPYDYFFGVSCCWGWATWKRCWQNVNYKLTFMDDQYAMKCVVSTYPYYKDAIKVGNKAKEVLDSGKKLSFWTYANGMNIALNSQLAIVPKYNLITNIGLSGDSGHSCDDIRKLPKRSQAYYNLETYELKFPLNDPKYVVEDRMYYKLLNDKFKWTFFTKIEYFIRLLIYSDYNSIKKKILKKIHK